MGRRKQTEELVLPLGGFTRAYQDRSDSETMHGEGRHHDPQPTRERLEDGAERLAVLLDAIAVIEAEMLTVACELGLGARPGNPQEGPDE